MKFSLRLELNQGPAVICYCLFYFILFYFINKYHLQTDALPTELQRVF